MWEETVVTASLIVKHCGTENTATRHAVVIVMHIFVNEVEIVL